MKNFVEELTWRGMIHSMMPGTEEQLMKEPTSAYVGIDPTADSLHIGHLVGIMMLKHFQACGHKPIALIGGATGMIGDHVDVLRLEVMGLGEIALGDRALHLVRRLAGRHVRDEIAIEEFHVVDPAWRAGSDLRE